MKETTRHYRVSGDVSASMRMIRPMSFHAGNIQGAGDHIVRLSGFIPGVGMAEVTRIGQNEYIRASKMGPVDLLLLSPPYATTNGPVYAHLPQGPFYKKISMKEFGADMFGVMAADYGKIYRAQMFGYDQPFTYCKYNWGGQLVYGNTFTAGQIELAMGNGVYDTFAGWQNPRYDTGDNFQYIYLYSGTTLVQYVYFSKTSTARTEAVSIAMTKKAIYILAISAVWSDVTLLYGDPVDVAILKFDYELNHLGTSTAWTGVLNGANTHDDPWPLRVMASSKWAVAAWGFSNYTDAQEVAGYYDAHAWSSDMATFYSFDLQLKTLFSSPPDGSISSPLGVIGNRYYHHFRPYDAPVRTHYIVSYDLKNAGAVLKVRKIKVLGDNLGSQPGCAVEGVSL